MRPRKALAALSALAQESRLAVFLLLLEEENGLAAGEIAEKLGVPMTTLSFHLSQLKTAELAIAEKQGRFIIYHANRKRARRLAQFISGKQLEKERRYQLMIGEAQES